MMLSMRWKALISSIVVYQVVLTWAVLDLSNTAAYLATFDCSSRCDDFFPYITRNQGGYETFSQLLFFAVVLVIINIIVYVCTRDSKATDNG